jgi:Restriction endonuclease BglII
MPVELLPTDIRTKYEVHQWKHACAVLHTDFRKEFNDIVKILRAFRLRKSEIVVGGGNISKISKRFNDAFKACGWEPKCFETEIVVDKKATKSPTHEVDCFKNRIALEIEWNNKDPFYDRDLNNFRLLFDLRVISVGVIITRCDELQEIFRDLGIGSSYGNSTTHMSKLLPRIEGGSGAGCLTCPHSWYHPL